MKIKIVSVQASHNMTELELILSKLKSFSKRRPLNLIKSNLEAKRILQMKL